LHRIKQDLAAAVDRAGLDVIAWLDLNRLGWRDALPVDMVDGDARTLAAIGGCRPGRPPPRGGAPPRERQGWPRARGLGCVGFVATTEVAVAMPMRSRDQTDDRIP
jgi:hypothetical protein